MNSLRTEMIRAVDAAFDQAKKIEGLVVSVDYQPMSGTYNPVTETYSETVDPKTIDGIKYSATQKQIIDGLAEVNDLFLTVKGKDFAIKPTVNDHIFIDGARYAIVFITDNTTGISYEFQLRR